MRDRSVTLLVVGGIFTLLIFSESVPWRKLNKARMHAQEAAALRDLQIVGTAQMQYNSQFGRYARSLPELGPSAANLIPADLAGGEKQGYKFTMTATLEGYSIQAVPVVFGSTGSRSFYSDQSLLIRQNHSPEPATAYSKETGSTAGKSMQGAP